MSEIKCGDAVTIRSANNNLHDVVAASGIERGHNFPIIWVQFPDGEKYPWPVEDVWHKGDPAAIETARRLAKQEAGDG